LPNGPLLRDISTGATRGLGSSLETARHAQL